MAAALAAGPVLAQSAANYPNKPIRYIVGNTQEQFTAFFKSEIEKWGKAVKASGARVD